MRLPTGNHRQDVRPNTSAKPAIEKLQTLALSAIRWTLYAQRMSHIGIVGVSAEGAALCYRTICVEGSHLFGPGAHPEVSMHTLSFAGYRRLSEREDWAATAEVLLSAISA
jgi:hypothetical protein